MADQPITLLNQLTAASAADVFPIVDIGASETKKIRLVDLMGSPGPIGAVTPSTGRFTSARLSYGTTINEFSTDVNMTGNSNDAVPTEAAVKSYVDNKQHNHNNLENLQGGDSTSSEFYHLTEAIYSGLFSASPIIGLGEDGGTSFQVDYGSHTIIARTNNVTRYAATNSGFRLNTGTYVTRFSTDGTLASDSDDYVPTEKAVKTYVDTHGGGGGDHNTLTGLQGGDSTADEFYHLTEAIYNGLFSASPLIGLGDKNGTNFQVDYANNTITGAVNGTDEMKLDSTGFQLRFSGGFSPVRPLIAEDTDLYIDPLGSDTTGDGTIITPWQTIDKALEYLSYFHIAGSAVVTINVGEGEYPTIVDQEEGFLVSHPDGDRIEILGPTVLNRTMVQVDNLDPIGSQGNWEIQIRLSETYTGDISIGDYAMVYNAAGTGTADFVTGCHKILNAQPSGESGQRLTLSLKQFFESGSYPTGDVTADVKIIKAVFRYSDSSGLILNNGNKLSKLYGIVLDGLSTNSGYAGIDISNNSILGIEDVGVTNFTDGILASHNSNIIGSGRCMTSFTRSGWSSSTGSSIVCNFAYCTGPNTTGNFYGFRTYYNGYMSVPWGFFIGRADSDCYGYHSSFGGQLNARYSDARLTGTGYYAERLGIIDAASSTAVQYDVDDYNPNVNEFGNDNGFIIGPTGGGE